MGFKKPTKIQTESLPWSLKGRDIIGLAQTGSGKTAAFSLPILQAMLASKSSTPLFACILAPTRELAIQISKHIESLGAGIGVRSCVVVGGIDAMTQAIALAKKPHVVVGTPGRVLYHLENTKGFSLRTIKYLVLDEADRLLNLDFEEEITKILALVPKERNTFLFSATMTTKVEKLQRASLMNPVKVEVASKYQTVDRLVQHYLFIPAKYKDCYLVHLLNKFNGNSVMVFTATRKETQRVALVLRALGLGAIPLHGNLSQAQRLGSLNKFTAGDRKILIATDVASRGLDIPSVDMVINYDMPTHSKDYIHRVGRTARGDRAGRAISLVTQYDVELFQRTEQLIGKKLDKFPAEEEEVLALFEHVSEAQRHAVMELKESGGGQKGGKRARDEPDEEDDAADETRLKKRSAKGGKFDKGGKSKPGKGGKMMKKKR
eukprot:TRINITY_DN1386_c0_g2_i1.p1 TRINITY_DN1386_c0_g2~~TRINITY_DN1386_c0_g2_i1.p1  ORF type:complete len:506 (-),score=148.31 TRINITY_DN1386_c0_g2_i1:174-1475(-)